ncbi:MAG TPA: hypothetical protein VLZ06_10920 [Solirubrobacteraceae bacterium]|nr:hypothetical protein [Solirubrobacteraceae bacterium]
MPRTVRLRKPPSAALVSAAVAVLATAGALIALASPAAASWAPPQTVATGSPLFGEPLLFAGPAGELLSWSYTTAAPHQTEGAGESAAGVGKRFGPSRPLPHGYNGRRLVELGNGRVAQLILTPMGLNTSAPSVALGSTSGAFARVLHASGSVYAGRASLAGDAHGDLLLAWISADRHGAHRDVWASVRPAGKGFAAPHLLNGSAQAEQVQTGVGPRGAMAIAFASKEPHERMFARVRPRGGGWGPQQRIGPAAEGHENDVSIFVTGRGEAVVAWYHTQLCEGGCESPGFVHVAVQPARARRFAPAQRLWRSPYGLNGASSGISLAPALAAAPGGAPLVAFLARVGSPGASSAPVPTAVMVAVPSGSHYGPARPISPPGQQEADVAAAAGPHGVLVTWIRPEPPHYGGPVVASIGDLGGHFGPPEQVSPSEEALRATPVFNPAGHWPANALAPWTVAWTGRPFGELFATQVTEAVWASAPLCPLPPASSDPACVGS